MSAVDVEEKLEIPRKKTPEEKSQEHLQRIKRSLIACVMGILTGVISYLVVPSTEILGFQSYTLLALVIMAAGIVIQRHLFVLMHLSSPPLGKKDWFYQGFMTFAFWFITWTILLTSIPQ
jgi:heme/copper-type cytochrome/quinol oxidase subunit 4